MFLHRYRFPRELSFGRQLFAWMMAGIGFTLLAQSTLRSLDEYRDSLAESDRALHHRFVGELLEIHQVFKHRAEEEGWRRFLTGYFSRKEIERDIRLVYEGALDAGFLDPAGRAEFALVMLHLGESDSAAAEYLETALLGDETWDEYTEVIVKAVNGEAIPENWPPYLLEILGTDWGTDLLAWRLGVTREVRFGDGWYERSIAVGTPSYIWLGVVLLFTIPCLVLLLMRGKKPLKSTRRWHPSIVLALTGWGLLIFHEAAALPWQIVNPLLDSDFFGETTMEAYYTCSIATYFLMQAGPVLVLAIVLTPSWKTFGFPSRSGFIKTMGLDKFRFSFVVIVIGLGGLFYLYHWAWFELVESKIGGVDTRDFLNADLIDSGRRGLIADLIIAAAIAPVFEELAFRGFLFTALRNRMGGILAAIVSTLVFALLHFYSWQGLLSVAIFGLVMCWVYSKTQSLWPCILFHALGNFQITLSVWAMHSSETLSWQGLYAY